MVVRDSIVSNDLGGTQVNPPVIGDDVAPLGSASNPIPINVDRDWCYDGTDRLGSDADTAIMATPEFWETLIDERFTVLADEGEAVGSSFIRAPTRSPVCEDPEDLLPFEQSSANRLHLDDKTLKVTESLFDVLRNCSGLRAAKRENVANGQAGKFSRRLFTAIVLMIF